MSDRFHNSLHAGMTNEEANEFAIEFHHDYMDSLLGVWNFEIPEMSDTDTCAIQEWLQKRGIPYVLYIEGKYEFDPEVRWWVPGMEKPMSEYTNADGEITVPLIQAIERGQEWLLSIPHPPRHEDLRSLRGDGK